MPPPKGDKFPTKYVLGVPNFLGNLAPGGGKLIFFGGGEFPVTELKQVTPFTSPKLDKSALEQPCF